MSNILFKELKGKRIAYRTKGNGPAIILANRFRGDLDKWDPKFIDKLAEHYQVITFDYSGIGLSTGTIAKTHLEMANDVKDFAHALGLKKFIIGGWSFGGFIAQIVTTEFPELVSHCILIGTRPPGADVEPPKEAFFERALKEVNDLDDEIVLFFNPNYEVSRQAAVESHERIHKKQEDKEYTKEQWEKLLTIKGYTDDQFNTYQKMRESKIPTLAITGEDDVSFPVESWFAKKGEFPSVFLLVLPQSGHGPQHQYPELSSKFIHDFISTNHSL